MKILGGCRDGSRWGSSVLLFCVTLGLAITAAAGQVGYETTGLTDSANNASGTGSDSSLKTAIEAINNAVETDGIAESSREAADIAVTVGNNQNAASGGDNAGYWHLHGTGDPDNYTAGYYGFNTIGISGRSATDKTVLSGNGVNTMLLKVLHAKESITVENLIVRDGSYTGGLTGTGDDAVFGSEAGGAGMTLGHNGVDGPAAGISAADTITVRNVDAERNSITVTSANTDGRNAFGAGILVNAHGSNASGPDGSSGVVFDTVGLTGNTIAFTSNGTGTDNTGGDVSIRGGGARIAFAKSFEFANGAVSGNKVTLTINDLRDANLNPHAAGGGISIDAGNAMEKVAINNVAFTGNTVTMNNNAGGAFVTGGPVSYARGGAIYYNTGGASGNEGITVTNSTFTNNSAVAGSTDSGREVHAAGGAGFFYLSDIDAVFSSVAFTGNAAASTAAAGDGIGGALAFYNNGGGSPAVSLEKTVFTGNSGSGTRNSYGGAIYMDEGALRIADSSFTGNTVSGGNALGSAIFMNTAGGSAASLDLEAGAGAKTTFSGNRVNGDASAAAIHFGNATGSLSQYDAEMTVGGAGIVELLNPLSVAMNNNKNFAFTKAGSGTLRWDGANYFDTVGGVTTLEFQDGVVELGKDFTASASSASGFQVNIKNGAEIRFDASRVESLALFDFTGAGSSGMTVDAGAKLVTTTGLSIKGYTKDFVIASGLSDAAIDSLLGDLDFSAGNSGYLSVGGLRKDGSDLVASVVFRSPFTRANATRATNALQYVVDNAPGISEAEVRAMYRNANNISPESFMDQGFVMIHAVDRVAGNAVQFGLRDPHRLRMRMESASYRPAASPSPYRRDRAAPAYMDAGNGQSLEDYDPYSVQSDEAYPRLMECASSTLSMSGFRFWTGYIGDWRSVSGKSGYNGYKVDRHGFLIGANYDFGTDASVGVYGGYSHAKTRARGADAEIRSDSGHFGLQGRLSPLASDRNFSVYGDLGYHFSSNELKRNLGAWNTSGDFDQDVFTIGLAAEYVVCLGSINLTPHAEARYTYLDQDDMNEGGTSSTRTGVTGFDRNSFITRAGVEVSYDIKTEDMIITPAVTLDWRHDYGTRRNAGTARYLLAPAQSFSVVSSRNDRDSLDIGVAVKALKSLGAVNLGFNLAYNANIASRSDTHSLYAGVELGF